MISVLVAEDDADKLKEVVSTLVSVEGISIDNIDDARDANAVRKLLRSKNYDLLILDIALPSRVDQDPSPNMGVTLLKEIDSRDTYNKPSHILGLTQHQDIQQHAGEGFEQNSWSIVLYERNSDAWKQKLISKVEHIRDSSSSNSTPTEYQSDLFVVTALSDPELKAVLDLPWGWEKLEIEGDPTLYYKGSFETETGTKRVFAAAARSMGMSPAAALSMKAILSFRPRVIAMTGILAGVKDDTNMGDIIVANPCWDWGSGKHTHNNGDAHFAAAPSQFPLDADILASFHRIDESNSWHTIREGWRGTIPVSALNLKLGPVASGASVISDAKVIDTIKSQNRKLLGVEMEAYGVMVSANMAPHPRPKSLALKSVCDFGDADKDDDFQGYAAYTSAKALELFAFDYFSRF